MLLGVTTHDELLVFQEQIFELFEAAFDRKMSEELWKWHYIDNPAGAPVVVLHFDGENLLGHYAATPTFLNVFGRRERCFRSMTSMVHPLGQGRGIFVEMGRYCYSILKDMGISLVYGFPNSQAAPGRRKHLGWQLLEPDFIVDVQGSELIDNEPLRLALFREGDVYWDITASAQLSWRMRPPGALIDVNPGLITKEYDGALNVLHFDRSGLASVDPNATYRILLGADTDGVVSKYREVAQYQFGYRFLDNRVDDVSFKRELIMSDVF